MNQISYILSPPDPTLAANSGRDRTACQGHPVSPAESRVEARRRIAFALGIGAESVNVEQSRVSLSGWTMHCYGAAGRARFCAKIYLVDQYPLSPRFTLPGDDLCHHEQILQPAEQHIATEWELIQRIRSLVGSRNNPALLGCSPTERTLVFEEIKGARADRLTRWAWPSSSKLRSLEDALFQAGAWLSHLHQASSRSIESLIPIDVLTQVRQLVAAKHLEAKHYRRLALQPLEAVCRQIGPRTPLRVPITMNHGDFSLPNLIWDGMRERLWVIDFELSSVRSILHDLCTMIFNLRSRLLFPFTALTAVVQCEKAFWRGYRDASANLKLLVSAIVTSRLFYYSLPRMSRTCGSGGAGRLV